MSQKEFKNLDNLPKIVDFMHNLLAEIVIDLEKSNKGNKAASQRVRTGTVKLEKVAKLYRKESILTEKHHSTKSKSKSRRAVAAKPKAAPAKSKVAAKAPVKAPAKAPAKATHHAKAPVKTAAKAPAAKVKTQKASVKPKAFAVKRPTAKLPSRSAGR